MASALRCKLALGLGLPEGPKDVETTILDIANWKSSINEGFNNGSIIHLEFSLAIFDLQEFLFFLGAFSQPNINTMK
jgi:hypothetical protein